MTVSIVKFKGRGMVVVTGVFISKDPEFSSVVLGSSCFAQELGDASLPFV